MIEFSYTPKDDFNYSEGKKVEHLILKAPKLCHLSIVSKVQQLIMQAMTSYQSTLVKNLDVKKTEEAELNGDVLLMMIQGAQLDNFFYSKFCDYFKSLLLENDICYINGDIKMGTSWLDKMSVNDFNSLMGAYIQNFLMPSALLKT